MAVGDKTSKFPPTRTESAGDCSAITTNVTFPEPTVAIKSKTGAATADVTFWPSGTTVTGFDFSAGYNPIHIKQIANLTLNSDTLWALFGVG